MTLYGLDISNHNTMSYRSMAEYQAADFVIVQAIDPPQPYTGWERGGYTAEQLRAGVADNKHVGVYVWLWNSFSTSAATQADIAARLALIPDDVYLDMRLWLDMEDTTQDHGPPRQQDVLDALEVMDQWSVEHGIMPKPGVYSGDWYLRGYMDAWFPPDRVYWQANYALTHDEASAALLPMRPCIQYTSDPIDQNAMLTSEVFSLMPQPAPEPDCAGLINGLAYVADDLGDRLLTEAQRPNVRKTVVRDIVKEMQRVRTEQIGPRP